MRLHIMCVIIKEYVSSFDTPGDIGLQPPQCGGRLDVWPVRVHRGALGESIRLLGLDSSSGVSLTVPAHRGGVLSKPGQVVGCEPLVIIRLGHKPVVVLAVP